MDISVKIPAALASECGGVRTIRLSVGEDASLGDLLAALDEDYPRLGRRIRDEAGSVRRYVNVYVGDEECRQLSGLDTRLKSDQPIQILPSIAGGA